jgi:hypothetical protein
MDRRPAFLVLVIAMLLVTVTPALAATSDSSKARSIGDGFVRRLRQTHACDLATKRGFIADGDSYLASCTTKDGSFRFIAVVEAKPGGLTTKSSYIEDQVNQICKGTGGVVFTAGTRPQFFAMYLGRGTGLDVATGLWEGLSEQLAAAGRFTTGEKCAQGNITEDLEPTTTTAPAATTVP